MRRRRSKFRGVKLSDARKRKWKLSHHRGQFTKSDIDKAEELVSFLDSAELDHPLGFWIFYKYKIYVYYQEIIAYAKGALSKMRTPLYDTLCKSTRIGDFFSGIVERSEQIEHRIAQKDELRAERELDKLAITQYGYDPEELFGDTSEDWREAH